MNIVLIGYRGTGKSHVGTILAKRYNRSLVSIDAEIVKAAGKSIPEIVAASGWPAFRDLETAEARKLAGCDHLVIDCGGGIIERPENVAILQVNAKVFWLRAEVATIVARIADDNQRPALVAGKTFTEEIAEVLEIRTPKYRAAAHYEIVTDGLTPEAVAAKIADLWEQAS
jgi:shikimate kinase